MQRKMLKSKIHRATVTACDLHYVGSITIDAELMRKADLLPNELVHVLDIDNGERLETYVIEGEAGSGEIQVNGAAAHLVHRGDRVIVLAYGLYSETELAAHRPRVVHVDDANRVVRVDADPSAAVGGDRSGPEAGRGGRGNPARRERRPVTVPRLAEMKRLGEPIVMVTAYDYPSAQVVEEAGVDVVLVGDTAAMTMLGYDGTPPVSLDEMLMLASAVRRGLRTPLLVGDLPFGSYQVSNEQAIESAVRFVKEAGCEAVKLEMAGLGNGPVDKRQSTERAHAIVTAGIPVMGHVGLTPQSAAALGGYRTQGRTAREAVQVADDALALQDAGCFAIVFEAIPAAVTETIVERLRVPVIGIGAGPTTSGQVLVLHDLLGIYAGHAPRFAKRFAELRPAMVEGVSAYAAAVRERSYPADEHCYAIDSEELERFREVIAPGRAWDIADALT